MLKIRPEKLKKAIQHKAVEETDSVVEHYLHKIGYNADNYYRDIRESRMPLKRVQNLEKYGIDTDAFVLGEE